MREIPVDEVRRAIEQLAEDAAFNLPDEFLEKEREMLEKEESELGRQVLAQLIENAELARRERLPLCQDTGLAVVFLEVGQEVHFTGGDLIEAINNGVRSAYRNHFLRKSVYANPYKRDKNTGDNTPAIVHVEIVPGENVKIKFLAKGGGSENMSALRMMKPADGIEGVKKFVVERVTEAGGNPCPPIVVGVGIGGNFEYCAYIAKKALLRPLNDRHPDPEIASLEDELLQLVNRTGVGPGGFGGTQTAVAVKVEVYPCHIASFPVAVNIECNAARHKEAVI